MGGYPVIARFLWSLLFGTGIMLLVCASTLPLTGYAIQLHMGTSATFPTRADGLLRVAWRSLGIERSVPVFDAAYGANGLPIAFMPVHISCCAIVTLGVAFTSGLLALTFFKASHVRRRGVTVKNILVATAFSSVWLIGAVIVCGFLFRRPALPLFCDLTLSPLSVPLVAGGSPGEKFYREFPAHYVGAKRDAIPILLSWITCAGVWLALSRRQLVTVDGECPTCGYDTRFSCDARCPECGEPCHPVRKQCVMMIKQPSCLKGRARHASAVRNGYSIPFTLFASAIGCISPSGLSAATRIFSGAPGTSGSDPAGCGNTAIARRRRCSSSA